MKTQAVSPVAVQYKSNKGKKAGAALGAAAGTAYVAKNSKELMGYIGRNLDKIQAKYPNISGNVTDVFKAYIAPKESKVNGRGFMRDVRNIAKSFVPTKEKKAFFMLKDKSVYAKKAAVMGGVVAAGALAGVVIGAVADKIKTTAKTKAQNKKLAAQIEEMVNNPSAKTMKVSEFNV